MIFYFFPLLSATFGCLFAFLLQYLFLNKHSNAKFTLKNQIRIGKPKLAETAGVYAESRLNPDELSRSLLNPDLLQALYPELEGKVDIFIKEKLPQKWPMLGMFLTADALEKIKIGLVEELQAMLPALLSKLSGNLSQKINIRNFTEQKILALSETEILEFLRPQIQHVGSVLRWIGALMGFVIGILAVLCFKILPFS